MAQLLRRLLPVLLLAGLTLLVSCPSPADAGAKESPLPEDYVKINGTVYPLAKATIRQQVSSGDSTTVWIDLVAEGIAIDSMGYTDGGDGIEFSMTFQLDTEPLSGHWFGELYNTPGLWMIQARDYSDGSGARVGDAGDGTYDLTVDLDGENLDLNGTFAIENFEGKVVFSGPVVVNTIP